MASSSLSPPLERRKLGDGSAKVPLIFLSHSGKQKGFVKGLNQELKWAGYRTFFDIDSLRAGEQWPDRIRRDATSCHVAVIVLSEEFVTSVWPMWELCIFVEAASVKLLPLFYKLSDKDLRNQQNIERWSQSWRQFSPSIPALKCSEALRTLNERNGLCFDEDEGELAYLGTIVSRMQELVPPLFLHYKSGLYGEQRMCKVVVDNFEELERPRKQRSGRQTPSVSLLALHGVPGSGKSTLSKCLCDQFFAEFSGKVLLLELPSNPSPSDEAAELGKVWTRLLRCRIEDTLGGALDVLQMKYLLMDNLPRSRVFLVVDNINNKSKKLAEAILESGFGPGSRVMLIARSSGILDSLLHTHEDCFACRQIRMPDISESEAVDILLHHAAGPARACEVCHNQSAEIDAIRYIVRACGLLRIPFVMEVLGRLLTRYERDVSKWETKLSPFLVKAKKAQGEAVMELIQASYDELSQQLKNIFLDMVFIIRPRTVDEACKRLSILYGITEENMMMMLKDLTWSFLGCKLEMFDIHDLYVEFAEIAAAESGRFLTCENASEIPRLASANLAVRRILLKAGTFERADLQDYHRVEDVIVRKCKLLVDMRLPKCTTTLLSLDIEDCQRIVSVRNRKCLRPVKRLRWVQNREDPEQSFPTWMQWTGWKSFLPLSLLNFQPQRPIQVGELNALQILEMRNTGTRQLSGLSNCRGLREFNVVEEKLEKFPDVSKLKQLKTFIFSDWRWARWSSAETPAAWEIEAECGMWVEKVLESYVFPKPRKKLLSAPDLNGCTELVEVSILLNPSTTLTAFPKFHTLPKLQSFYIRNGGFSADVCRNLIHAGPPGLQLSIGGSIRVKKISHLDKLSGLTKLVLCRCAKLVDISGLCSLLNLTELTVKECAELVDISGLCSLLNLTVLTVEGCVRLRIVSGGLETCKNLRRLGISNCRALIQTSFPGGLPSLVSLLCENCDALERIPELSNLKHLKFLTLYRLPLLKNISGLFALSNLSSAYLRGLPFPTNVPGSLSLPNFTDPDCVDEHDRICACCDWPIGPVDVSGFSNLKSLELTHSCNLTRLEGLWALYNLDYLSIASCPNLTSITSARLIALKYLYCSDCPNLKHWEHCSAEMPRLEKVQIERCESLERFPLDFQVLGRGRLIALKSLYCSDCPNLKHWEHCSAEMPRLEVVQIKRCESLERFPLDFQVLGRAMLQIYGCKFADDVRVLARWIDDDRLPFSWRYAALEALAYKLLRVHEVEAEGTELLAIKRIFWDIFTNHSNGKLSLLGSYSREHNTRFEDGRKIFTDLMVYMLWEDGYPCEQTLASLNDCCPTCNENDNFILSISNITLVCKGHEETLVQWSKSGHLSKAYLCLSMSYDNDDWESYDELTLPWIILHLTTSSTLLSKLSHETKSILQVTIELLINGLKKEKFLINGVKKKKEKFFVMRNVTRRSYSMEILHKAHAILENHLKEFFGGRKHIEKFFEERPYLKGGCWPTRDDVCWRSMRGPCLPNPSYHSCHQSVYAVGWTVK